MVRVTSPQVIKRPVPPNNPEITRGRCRRCTVAFAWKRGTLRLKDARCPWCDGALAATVYCLKSVPIYALYGMVWEDGGEVYPPLPRRRPIKRR